MTKLNRKNVIYAIGVAALLVIAYYSRALHTQVDEPVFKMLFIVRVKRFFPCNKKFCAVYADPRV